MKVVTAQLDEHGRVVRIFKTGKDAARFHLPVGHTFSETDRTEAVREIRRQVFERQDYLCRHCPNLITWAAGEMNEIVPKGRGGEVSLDNCEALCHDCHQGRTGVHGNRRTRFGERRE